MAWEHAVLHTVHLPVVADQLWVQVRPQVVHLPLDHLWVQLRPQVEHFPLDQL